MLRTARAVALVGLLLVIGATPSTAQEPGLDADDLAALCEANSPDDATLAECLEIVETVLLPSPLTRAGAVARVLAIDPRFADLPDWRDLRIEGFANFESLILENSYYRDLTSLDGQMSTMEFYWVAPSPSLSRLVEVTLVQDCADWGIPEGVELTDDTEPFIEDPCEWRHSWYYRVAPDGAVTLLFDEGDPDT